MKGYNFFNLNLLSIDHDSTHGKMDKTKKIKINDANKIVITKRKIEI